MMNFSVEVRCFTSQKSCYRLILQTVDRASTALQGVQLHFSAAREIILAVKVSLQALKDINRFEPFWEAAEAAACRSGVDDPAIPRTRKTSGAVVSVKEHFFGKYVSYIEAILKNLSERFLDSDVVIKLFFLKKTFPEFRIFG